MSEVKNALVVVAHDDDVVLWMSGTVHRLRNWKWHFIVVCNSNDNCRAQYFASISKKFEAICNILNFRNYQDKNCMNDPYSINSITEIKSSIFELIRDKKFDFIFTHRDNVEGEYGRHDNHKEVCDAVLGLASDGKIKIQSKSVAHFSYSPIYRSSGISTVARIDAKYYMQLKYDEIKIKVDLIQSHPNKEIVKNSEDDLGSPCPNPEAFDGKTLELPQPFIKGNF